MYVVKVPDWFQRIPSYHANLLRGLVFLVAGGVLYVGPTAFSIYGILVAALGLPFFALWSISMYVRLRGPDLGELDEE